jgi:hypothetical protein
VVAAASRVGFIFEKSLPIETEHCGSELKSRTRDTYAKFPKQLQVSKTDLLERLSTERAVTGIRKLLEVAREMLDLTVFLWLERDRSVSRKHDYDFIVGEQTIVYRLLLYYSY